jgi:hypothetical protein
MQAMAPLRATNWDHRKPRIDVVMASVWLRHRLRAPVFHRRGLTLNEAMQRTPLARGR